MMKKMILNKKALSAAIGMVAVIGFGAFGNAQATAVAYAVNQITNFGVTSSTTYSIIGTPSVTNFNSAAYTGAVGPLLSTTLTTIIPAANDPLQATAGPGLFPTENNYSFLSGTVLPMIGSRGDSNTSAGSPFIALGGTGIANINNVAEARVATGFGTAGSSGGNNTAQATLQIALAGSGTITFTYRDVYQYYATTSGIGETAQGTISNHFTIADSNGASVFNDSFAAININCASNSGIPSPCNSGLLDTGIISATSGVLLAGNYTISLASTSLAVAASAAIPEPDSILLFGLGLGAIGFTMRRKQTMV